MSDKSQFERHDLEKHFRYGRRGASKKYKVKTSFLPTPFLVIFLPLEKKRIEHWGEKITNPDNGKPEFRNSFFFSFFFTREESKISEMDDKKKCNFARTNNYVHSK